MPPVTTPPPRIQMKSLACSPVLLGSGLAYPQGNVSVKVYQSGTNNLVTIYQDATGSGTLGQPLKTDHNGEIPGYITAMQIVDVSVAGGPVKSFNVPSGTPALEDLADGAYWITQIQAAGGGGGLRLDQIPAPTADVSMANHKLINLADATAAQDALNRRTGDARYDASGAATAARNQAFAIALVLG